MRTGGAGDQIGDLVDDPPYLEATATLVWCVWDLKGTNGGQSSSTIKPPVEAVTEPN